MDARMFASNVLPESFLGAKEVLSSLTFRDLNALSGGHDFLLQASNPMCAETAFDSLHLPWLAGRLDAQAVAALRTSGARFTSTQLQQAVAAPVPATGAAADVLLLFSVHDVMFDPDDRCRVRVSVRVAIGSLFRVPKEPILVHGLEPGEAVMRVADAVSHVGQTLLAAGAALAPPPQAMRTLFNIHPGALTNSAAIELDSGAGIWELDRHVDLGDRTSFDVSTWLGGGLLEIAAPFAATADRPAATIRVAADVSQTNAHFTDLSHDAALLLSAADPLGLVQTTTQRVRQRGRLALVDDLSLVGGPATATVGHLDTLEPDAFACGQGACALNVGATIVSGRVAARNTIAFIRSSRYGVVWSADAVKLLVRYCWETHAFPRSILQTSAVRLAIDGVEQTAEAISDFHLDDLEDIALEYDANGRRDILYTKGKARVVPKFIRLNDGRELVAQDPNDPVFAPSEPRPWEALGDLTEQPLPAFSPDVLWFERAVTRGVTSRLGRPFTDPSDAVEVTDSRLSAPQQRIALLVT